VRADLLAALGVPVLRVGAVCVYHEMIAPAVAALHGSGIPVAAVVGGRGTRRRDLFVEAARELAGRLRVRMAPEETRARLLREAERVARETFGGAVTRTVTCSAFVGRRP
jgi:hypothetical protein